MTGFDQVKLLDSEFMQLLLVRYLLLVLLELTLSLLELPAQGVGAHLLGHLGGREGGREGGRRRGDGVCRRERGRAGRKKGK